MAEKRMFSKSIIGSAKFLRMPVASRLLYYDLGMQADDDGVVEAFAVLRTTGASEADLQVLVAKGFVTVLNEDLVSFIHDWKVNNNLRSDRYRPSVYHHLLTQLEVDDGWLPDGCQVVARRLPQDRIGEGRVDQDRIGEGRVEFAPPTVEEVATYCRERANKVDPQQFVDHYTSNGWKVGGKGAMKDWKAAVRTWEKNGYSTQKKSSPNNMAGQDFNASRDRIKKSGDWLDEFLAQQDALGGGSCG